MTSVFGSRLLVRLWSIRINYYEFCRDIFVGSSNYDPIMAIMAFPYKSVFLFDLKKTSQSAKCDVWGCAKHVHKMYIDNGFD